MSYNLEKYSLAELKTFATKMGLHPRRTKTENIKDIEKGFKEYEEYKKEKVDKYTRVKQLGKGKEGTTFLVKNEKGKQLAMKTFSSTKSSSKLKKEYALQKKAASFGVAPKVYDYDTVGKWIVMEKMDSHLFYDTNKLSREAQKRIIEIYKSLDQAKVFHGDCNTTNYMVKKDKIYLVDYGLAREITSKLLNSIKTKTPNYTLSTIALVLKLKEMNFDSSSYSYLLKHISEENKEKYGLLGK